MGRVQRLKATTPQRPLADPPPRARAADPAVAGGIPGGGDRAVRPDPADGAVERAEAGPAVGRAAGGRGAPVLCLARPGVRCVGERSAAALEPLCAGRDAA